MRFQLQNPSDKSWSFSLLSNEGDVLLNSSTFTSREEAVDYIRQSILALRTDQRIRISGSTFELTDADGNAIGTSITYNTQEAARTASELLQMQANGTEDFAVEFTTTTTTTTAGTRRKLATKIPTPPSRVEMTKLYDVTRATISGNMGFDLFEEGGKYYYLFNSSNGYPMLFSKGFDTSSKRKTNIRSTLRYAGKEKYYEKVEENGQFYFIIKTPNGFECARSARYATAADRDTAITYFIANSPDYKKEYAKPTKKAREAAQEYVFDRPSTEGKGFEAFRNDEKRKHYFHFNNDQGKAILFSQGYKGGKARDNGIRSVIKNSTVLSRFKIKEKNGQWFFVLLAANNTEIARSQMLGSEAAAKTQINYINASAKSYAATYEVDLAPKTQTTSSTETFNLNVDIPEEPKVDEAALAMAAAATLAAENKKKEEEAARLAAEAEAKRKAEAEKAAKLEAERKAAIEKRAAELEAKRKADEAKRATEAEAKRKADEAKRAAEAEAKRKVEEAEAAKKAEEQRLAAAAAATAAATALAAKKAEEAKKAEALAAQQKAEAEQRAAQAEKDRLAAQAKREEEAKLAAAKKAEEAKRAERARIAAEEEKARKAKAHADRLAAQAARKEEKAAAAAMAAATTASSGGGDNGAEYGGGSWFGKNWWWLLLLILALLALMYFLRGCEGCAKKEAVVVKEEVVAPVVKEEVKEIVEPVKEEPKVARGKNGAQLGFAKGTLAYRMADCLADPDCTLPGSYTMDAVQFTTGEAHMNKGAYPTVDDLAKLMKAYPNMKMDIVGHIDGTEKDAYNGAYQDGSGITLSEIRSRCLYKKLQKRGIAKSRLRFLGKGKTQNIGDNNTTSGRQENRRLELIIDLK